MCDRSADDAADKLECIDGKCAKPPAPTPAPPATDPPPACSKQGIKCYDGDTSDYTAAECCAGVRDLKRCLILKSVYYLKLEEPCCSYRGLLGGRTHYI